MPVNELGNPTTHDHSVPKNPELEASFAGTTNAFAATERLTNSKSATTENPLLVFTT